jgi:predicted SprT family Zn-dependent metalloprotease
MIPVVKFSNQMKVTSGTARIYLDDPSKNQLTFSNFIIENNDFEKYIATTVPHECAHIISEMCDGIHHGHDSVWRKTYCEVSGLEFYQITQKHSYQVQHRKPQPRYMVRCSCGKEFYITATRRNKMLKGTRYRHICGGVIQLV